MFLNKIFQAHLQVESWVGSVGQGPSWKRGGRRSGGKRGDLRDDGDIIIIITKNYHIS